MAAPAKRRPRKREAETKEAQDRLDRVGAGRRHHDLKNRPWKDCNPVVELLAEMHVATGEPVFTEALKMADLYGFTQAADPMRRIREVGALLSRVKAVPFVEAELRRQKEQGKRRSMRKACEWAAEQVAIEAPSVETARKHVEATWKAHQRGDIPDGYTGCKLLCAAAFEFDPMSWRLGYLSWERDDTRTRKHLKRFGGVVLKTMCEDHPAQKAMKGKPPDLQAEISRELREWDAEQLSNGAMIAEEQAQIRAIALALGSQKRKVGAGAAISGGSSSDRLADAIFAACGYHDGEGNLCVDPQDVERLLRMVADTGSISKALDGAGRRALQTAHPELAQFVRHAGR